MAAAGLNYLHSSFEFVDSADGKTYKFKDYMAANVREGGPTFKTGEIEGTGAKEPRALVVPYKNRMLCNQELKDQLNKWASYGTMERDTADALISMVDQCNSKLDLSNDVFVLIGAGSAMGPFSKLLEHGATLVCIDIPGTFGPRAVDMWKRLMDTARKSPGKIYFPMRPDSRPQSDYATPEELIAAVGCNLTEEPAAICNWILSLCPGKRLTVGNYTYLDSDLHVKLSIAADAIMDAVIQRRKDTNIAFLCTPTDIHVITEDAYKAAVKNYGWNRAGRLIEALIQSLSFGKLLRKNVLPPLAAADGSYKLKVVDGLSVAQGPNYALAKRIQHWRAMLQYSNTNASGRVSSHVAPSTATLSVVSNKTFGWAYGGMPYFKPYEIFQQETTNALMAALLLYDVANPTTGVSDLSP